MASTIEVDKLKHSGDDPISGLPAHSFELPYADGTEGQALVTDGSKTLAFDTVGGGGWTQLATHTFSSAAQSYTFSDIDLSTYDVMRLKVADIKRSNNQYTYIQISNDNFTNTNTWLTFSVTSLDNTTTDHTCTYGGTRGGGGGTELYLTPHAVWTATYINAVIDFVKCGSLMLVNGMGVVSDDGEATAQWSGVLSASTFTHLKVHSYTGTFDSGTFTLAGM